MKPVIIRGGRDLRRVISQVLILLVLVVGQPFLWRFVRSSAQALHGKRTAEQQQINLRQRLDEIEQATAEQQPLVEQLATSFPARNLAAQVVERLEQLSDERGVEIDIRDISERDPLAGRGKVRLVPLVVTVEAAGSPDQLLGYLEAVEHVPEVVTISEWALESFRGTTGGPAVGHRLTMSVVFYLSEVVEPIS